jgi:hypothetical protein
MRALLMLTNLVLLPHTHSIEQNIFFGEADSRLASEEALGL